MESQRPLPTSPFPDLVVVQEYHPSAPKTPQRINSKRSVISRDSNEMDVDDSTTDRAKSDDTVDHSGDESKKKKQKKTTNFYCTGYPGCNLSFTRSEHLARHIRKHTGERPFECHCKRTFSRLDNLRQHAQTVHHNEEIPPDSLAATGTRYQKAQLGRPSLRHGPRGRASTGGSAGRPIRGHSKSFSTSSIAPIATVTPGTDPRRRPTPLAMAEPQTRLSFDLYGPDSQGGMPGSPSDFDTPTSATFSTGQNSPRYGVSSPNFSQSRSYHDRRLSVPSGGNAFIHGSNSPHYAFAPVGSDVYAPTNNNYPLSPTTSITPGWSRRESVHSRVADEVDRRRTWHPDTLQLYHRESRLSQVITPSQIATPAPEIAVRSDNNPDQQQQQTTLPSVKSLLRDVDSNMANQAAASGEINGAMEDSRRNSGVFSEWDRSLHRRINDLNISNSPRDGAGTWANETNQAVLAQAERTHVVQPQGPPPPTVRFNSERESSYGSPSGRSPLGHHHAMSAPIVTRNYDSRRQGWYNGPLPNRPSPPDTIHEGRAHVDRLEHPNFRQFSGFPARNNPPVVHQHPAQPTVPRAAELHGTENSPLDVLVAAASSLETASSNDSRGMNSAPQDQIMRDAGEQQRDPRFYYPTLPQCTQQQALPRCQFCGERNTPEWREGPDGPGTLCNSCGLQYMESRRQADRRFEPPRTERYVGQQV